MIYSSYDLNPISKRFTMRKQTHKVELTSEERQTLETLVRKGAHSALKLMRAHILLRDLSQGSVLDGCENPRRLAATHKPPIMFVNGLPGERLGALAQETVVCPTCRNSMGAVKPG